jgi:hypothetical protein
VRAAIWTPSDARYLFLIALPLQVNGRYNHLKIVNITEERGGGHTHVWVITVPSERINSGDPRQFTNAGRGEASIAIHTHTHTHTRSLHTRNSYKVHRKRRRRRRKFFNSQLCDGSGPSKATGSSSCFSF